MYKKILRHFFNEKKAAGRLNEEFDGSIFLLWFFSKFIPTGTYAYYSNR